jgi:hypothetical protein
MEFLSEQLAAQAEFIVNNFDQSDYQHDLNIDVDDGIYDCDCSGFVSFVLWGVSLKHYGLVPRDPGGRPLAFDYYSLFAGLDSEPLAGWQAIDFLKEACRGDIIAWQLTPGLEPGKDTGHVFFVAEKPRLLDSGIFAVRVYDSAEVPHFDDTREDGETGVGSGFINFQVDANGAPTAFQVGPSDLNFYSFPIAIGRVEPL